MDGSSSDIRKVVIRDFGGPEVLKVERVPRPEPEPGKVRIAVRTAGVAFGDTLRREGRNWDQKPPVTVGYDVAGTIDAVGANVTGWQEGERVAAFCNFGGYAEAIAVSPETLARIPDAVDDVTAVALTLNYGTALQMMRHVAKLKKGDCIVLTSAAGGVGTALLDLARELGIRAIGLASAGKHDTVRAFGGLPVDYRRSDVVEEVRKLTGGTGADVTFDGVGGTHLLRSRAMTRRDGRLVVFGVASTLPGGRPNRAGMLPTYLAVGAMRAMPGPSAEIYVSTESAQANPARFTKDMSDLFQMAAEGRLHPLIHSRIPLDGIADAHRDLADASVAGKIVIDMAI